jgi:hypothetical protein
MLKMSVRDAGLPRPELEGRRMFRGVLLCGIVEWVDEDGIVIMKNERDPRGEIRNLGGCSLFDMPLK